MTPSGNPPREGVRLATFPRGRSDNVEELRWTFDTFVLADGPEYPPTQAVLDESVLAALVRWGRVSVDRE